VKTSRKNSSKRKDFYKVNVAIIILVVALAAVIVWQGIPAKREFVQNETFERTSDLFYDYETTRYPSNVEIISTNDLNITIGIVTDQWNLNFGIIPNGGSHATRHLNVSNMEGKPVKASFATYGAIKSLISFSSNGVMLNPGDSVSFDIFLNTTGKTAPGNYSGEIDMVIQKPKYNFVYSFW
jgi:hypothetical protein